MSRTLTVPLDALAALRERVGGGAERRGGVSPGWLSQSCFFDLPTKRHSVLFFFSFCVALKDPLCLSVSPG